MHDPGSVEKHGNSFRCHMVSWDEAYRLAKILANKIKRSGFTPDLVIGIARGGFVPACTVCDLLIQKDLVSVKTEHWGIAAASGRAKIKYSLPIEADISGKRILVVDDVADTGDTFFVVTDHINRKNPAEIRTAVLHYKTSSIFIPDYWGEKQDEWKWIIYPWALYEDLAGFIERVLIHPMTHEDIREGLKSNFDIKIPIKDILEILNDMSLAGSLKRTEKDRKVFWENVEILKQRGAMK